MTTKLSCELSMLSIVQYPTRNIIDHHFRDDLRSQSLVWYKTVSLLSQSLE